MISFAYVGATPQWHRADRAGAGGRRSPEVLLGDVRCGLRQVPGKLRRPRIDRRGALRRCQEGLPRTFQEMVLQILSLSLSPCRTIFFLFFIFILFIELFHLLIFR